MQGAKTRRTGRVGIALAAVLAAMVVAPVLVAANDTGPGNRLLALGAQTSALGTQIDALGAELAGFGLVPPVDTGAENPVIRVSQSSRDVANINLRLSALEEQIRLLTGQVEGLQFQMTQFQNLISNMQEDYEFRFQQLEGGGLGKTDAVIQSGGATPSAGSPQDQTNTGAGGMAESGEQVPGAQPAPLGTLSAGDITEIEAGAGNPLDLDIDPGAIATDADADAQYRAGYEAVVRGDYQFAEDQFRQFIALYPDHGQAPDAVNWLAEALIQRGAYDEAAEMLLSGFEAYQGSTRAPDLLLRLGVALTQAGERDTACRTFIEILRRYPDATPAFLARVSEEQRKAQC